MHEGTSLWWYLQSRNKKSIAVNLKSPVAPVALEHRQAQRRGGEPPLRRARGDQRLLLGDLGIDVPHEAAARGDALAGDAQGVRALAQPGPDAEQVEATAAQLGARGPRLVGRGGEHRVAPCLVPVEQPPEAVELLLQLADRLEQRPPVLHRLAHPLHVERLGIEHEGAHEGAGVEDRLEGDGIGEAAQEMARVRHRRALAQGQEQLGGEALAGGPELLEALRLAAQIDRDLAPGRGVAALPVLAGVVGDLEAVAGGDEAREHGLAALRGARGQRQPHRDDSAGMLVLEDQDEDGLAGFPGRAPALGWIADPAEAIVAYGARAAARGRGVQRQPARIVAGKHGADRVEDGGLAGARGPDERGRAADADLLAPDQVPVRDRDVGEAVHPVLPQRFSSGPARRPGHRTGPEAARRRDLARGRAALLRATPCGCNPGPSIRWGRRTRPRPGSAPASRPRRGRGCPAAPRPG
ncbi:hypothetical protein MET9862_04877 [Methylobacterium symbioticum]|uniref:Uncharacterized protein n=1 Tax=Methylobacterium symbioticum TaxID=2584084 RepID=A0A509EL87_9HYPH|nr:hypothetical protein MET9862_04877 [Methylobacterium symbioticum]